MRKSILTLTLVTTLALSACAPPTMWTNPGITAEGWAQDQYACKRDMRMSMASLGNIYTQEYHAKQFYHRC